MVAAFSTVSGSLQANTLSLGLGIWPGERDPAISKHMFMDDLMFGFGFGRFDVTPWEDTKKMDVFPVSIQYYHDIGNGKIFAGINYVSHTHDHAFAGISADSISFVEIQDYRSRDGEFEVGYELTLSNQIMISPKGGIRHHDQSYIYHDLTAGTGLASLTINSGSNDKFFSGIPYVATARGGFMGINFGFKVAPKVTILAELAMSTPLFGNITGEFEGSTVTIGVTGGTNGFYEYQFVSSSYEVNFQRFMLGVQYDITEKIHVMGGICQETLFESYPGYFNLPIVIAPGAPGFTVGLTAGELVTDMIFYEEKKKTEKGTFFIGLTYDIRASSSESKD
ncbi:MAG: hypothetical protein OEZ34_04770 [Spirochaetia bacterium]|nr:hypothetical protein [Spirochaetia bacterium]